MIMIGKCKIAECGAPEIPCHDGCEDYTACPNFIREASEKKSKKEKPFTDGRKSNLSWTGHAFSLDELSLVSSRTNPFLIGLFGKADAGKTTFLAMVYTLLLNGKTLKDYSFAGTKTILGWDELHHRLRLKKGCVPFPPPTPVSSNRLYHFALRNRDEQLRDFLFPDASGEVFSLWSVNRDDENAESARWIYANANAFMLFIDCEALILQKNLAKREIMHIAKQLTHDLKNRPVIAVWSKSDKMGEVHSSIKDSLKAELANLFTNYKEMEISNYLEPGPDELVHKNNLSAIDWLLEKVMLPSNPDLTITDSTSDDLLINYKGK
jgi:hypothetical protein